MSQLKDERRMKEIFDRGAPYPWDFWESSESRFAGQDYETYWQEEEATMDWLEDPEPTESRTEYCYRMGFDM